MAISSCFLALSSLFATSVLLGLGFKDAGPGSHQYTLGAIVLTGTMTLFFWIYPCPGESDQFWKKVFDKISQSIPRFLGKTEPESTPTYVASQSRWNPDSALHPSESVSKTVNPLTGSHKSEPVPENMSGSHKPKPVPKNMSSTAKTFSSDVPMMNHDAPEVREPPSYHTQPPTYHYNLLHPEPKIFGWKRCNCPTLAEEAAGLFTKKCLIITGVVLAVVAILIGTLLGIHFMKPELLEI